ncbi:MAG: hypothetical protein ACJ72N_22035 [Labedaea sp.]
MTVVGRKGSGKSLLCHRLFVSYPFDKLVIDPHADTRSGPYALEATELETPLPLRLLPLDEGPTTWRYVPSHASPTVEDDMDRAVGLAYARRRMCCWIDEVGDVAGANRTGPHMREALHKGRHRDLTLIMAGPRPITVDPLVVSQADYVYVFDLPNPRDRRRVADNIGWDPKEFDAAVHGLGAYAYLRYDARAHDLVEFPPLPLRRAS